MRQALSIILAAVLFGAAFGSIVGVGETAEREATTNQTSIYGLHVALPVYMTNFPKELVPLP
ncbi:MAG TPA: hypothetical protein VI358_15155 [Pseudolabrys sp.]